MRTHATILSALLLAAAVTAPAHANWFSEGFFGHKNVGSAPNPTPDDLRAIGDSDRGIGKSYVFDRRDGHWHEIVRVQARVTPPLRVRPAAFTRETTLTELRAMDGKMVVNAKGVKLGRILTVDEGAGTVILQTTQTPAVTVPAGLLTNGKTRVMAKTLSKKDLMDMARTQSI